MRAKFIGVFLAAGLAIAGTADGADNYKIDGTHSHVGFAVRHFAVTDMICFFKEVAGSLVVDADDISKSSVEVVINTHSLDSEFEDRVDAVKSQFFLDVEKYPEITFKSRKITKGHIVGDLTIRGVTKEVEFPYELVGPVKDPWGNDRLGIAATLKVSRRDFGIMFDRKMADGSPLIGDDVKIRLSVEAARM